MIEAVKNHNPFCGPETVRAARRKLLQMHFQAGVGHIGGNLSVLDALLVLFHEFVGADEDLILSKGHGAGALYTALWSCGRLEGIDLDTFHGEGTLLAGHPPAGRIDGIPFATGSLGHGASLAAGIAHGCKIQREDKHIYCVTSDGEWQEGSTWEALIYACHNRLDNLTIFVDHNGLQGFGDTTSVASMAPLGDRLSGFPACISHIEGHDLDAIRSAAGQRFDTVHIVVMETTKGRGISFMEDKMEWHYLPMKPEQFERALEEIG